MKFVDVPDSKRIERDPDNRNVVFSDGKITQDDVETVSYTHLTLPTSDLV